MVVLGDESLQRHCGGSLITVLRCVQRREIPSTPAALLKQLNSEGYLQAQEQQRRSVRDSYEVPASRQLCRPEDCTLDIRHAHAAQKEAGPAGA